MPGPSDLELRPLWESEDFDPEIATQVNDLRAKVANGAVHLSPRTRVIRPPA